MLLRFFFDKLTQEKNILFKLNIEFNFTFIIQIGKN